MKVLSESKYICEICHKIYPTAAQARECQEGHDIIFVGIERGDLKRLLYFLHTGERQLLTPQLLATLEKYATISSEPPKRVRGNYIPQFEDENGQGNPPKAA